MMPRKENSHLKPDVLIPPDIPEQDLHLQFAGVLGLDEPQPHEGTPTRIKEQIRNRYAELLRQHDAIEVAYWAIEGFGNRPEADGYDLLKYKAYADRLYAEGRLAPNSDLTLAMKIACAVAKDKLPGVSKSKSNYIADQMILNWLDGNFTSDREQLAPIQVKIRQLKEHAEKCGGNCEWDIALVMNGWLDRLYSATLPNGRIPDEPWDDLEIQHTK